MKKSSRVLLIISMSIVMMTTYGLASHYILFPIFIADYCYFHSNEPSFIVNLLFDFPGYNAYHPVPAKAGYLLFGIIGFFIAKLLINTISKSRGFDSIDLN